MKAPVRRTPTHRPAFTLLEILMVITIMALIAAILIGGAFAATRFGKEKRTEGALATLDTILDEYERETGHYPSATTLPEFLDEVAGVGKGHDMIGTLGSALDNSDPSLNLENALKQKAGKVSVKDGWGRRMRYWNPGSSGRPWFWSEGANAQDDSGGNGGVNWSGENVTYNSGDHVGYNGRVYVCLRNHTSSASQSPTDPQLWRMTDDYRSAGGRS